MHDAPSTRPAAVLDRSGETAATAITDRAQARALSRLQDAIEASRSVRTRPLHRRPSHTTPGGWALVAGADVDLWQVHVRYHRRRRPEDRALLVAHYEGYARALGRRLHKWREGEEDVSQVALEGLLLALDRFDPSQRRPFQAFATPTIEGTVKRYFRDIGYSVRITRSAQDAASRIRDARAMLEQDLGREPTEGEMADLLDCDRPTLASMLSALASRSVASLDQMVVDMGDDDGDLVRAELRLALRQCIDRLPPDDQELIGLYFVQGLRQADIAERKGCSQMHVSRQLRRIVSVLRDLLGP